MRIRTRLLKCIPFVVLSYFLIDIRIKEEGCWGIIQGIYVIALLLGLIISGTIALGAAFRKRETQKIPFEPITVAIILIVTGVIIFCKIGAEHLRGESWLIAQTVKSDFFGLKHTLQLRTSGRYIVEIHDLEWSCTYPGRFSVVGDTLTLNNNIAAQTQNKFVEKYLIVKDSLIPLTNSSDYIDSIRQPRILQILKRQ